jgi:hypothetical protein
MLCLEFIFHNCSITTYKRINSFSVISSLSLQVSHSVSPIVSSLINYCHFSLIQFSVHYDLQAVTAQLLYRQTTGWTAGVPFPAGERDFSLVSRPALGPIQPHIQRIPGALFMLVKRPGPEADHSPPSSAEVKNGGAISPLPHTSS